MRYLFKKPTCLNFRFVIVFCMTLWLISCKDDDKGCKRNNDCAGDLICVNHKCQINPSHETDSDTVTALDTGTATAIDTTTASQVNDTASASSDTETGASTDSDSATEVCFGTPVQENGETCTSNCDCFSGHCNNGFCCQDGTCCAVAGDCPTLACNSAGCAGARCMYSPAAYACGDGFAVNSVVCSDGQVCNGTGSCVPLTSDCGAYRPTTTVTCTDTGASTCYGDCTPSNQSAHCASGYHCNNSMCVADSGVAANGADCTSGDQCASGYCDSRGFCCIEGACCESNGECDGDSEFCNGVFLCLSNVCQMDIPVDPCPSNICNMQTCDETTRSCISGADPCESESDLCNTKTCRALDDDSYVCLDNFADIGEECDDGIPCNGSQDTCILGECVPAGDHVSACFDDNPCTIDSCTMVDDNVNCTNTPVASGASCTEEFSCFGQNGTCKTNESSGQLECVASADVCANNGICTVSQCTEQFTPTGNSASCRTDSFIDYLNLSCGDTVTVEKNNFLFRTYFDYNTICNPSQNKFSGMESQIQLALAANTTSATVTVESITPSNYQPLSLFLFSIAPCSESSCLASGIGNLTFDVTNSDPYVIVLDSADEPFPPESVTLALTCTL